LADFSDSGLSTLAITIPAAFHIAITSSDNATQATQDERDGIVSAVERDIISLSHGVAIILLIAYVGYLVFQLWTHAYLYKEPADPLPNSTVGPHNRNPHAPMDSLAGGNNVFRLPAWSSSSSSSSSSEADEDGDQEVEEVKLTTRAAMLLIFVVTVLAGFTSEWLVSSINGLTTANNISPEWVALILLPLIGNAAEHVVAVSVSLKNKRTSLAVYKRLLRSKTVDLSIQVCIGRSDSFFPLLLRLSTLFEQLNTDRLIRAPVLDHPGLDHWPTVRFRLSRTAETISNVRRAD
jgi:Ca2+/H+ antiporter